MDLLQSTSLLDRLRALPDPRQPRGRRHAWWVVLALLAAGLAAGHRTPQAIAEWAALHQADLAALLPLFHGRPPSASTFQRALRTLDLDQLEALLADPADPADPAASHHVLDGKCLRGSRNGDAPAVHLLTRWEVAGQQVVGQLRVPATTNEAKAARAFLEQLPADLGGSTVSLDAAFCQRELTDLIRRRGGHWLMVVKRNQRELLESIAFLFESVGCRFAEDPRIVTHHTLGRGHGRLEARVLEASGLLAEWLQAEGWCGLQQVLRRTCRRQLSDGRESVQVSYAITSLAPEQASAAVLETLWRDHWQVENRVHYVRDQSQGEDACRVRSGSAPQALAALRNGVLNLARAAGYRYLPQAQRWCATSPAHALAFIGLRRL